MRFLFLSIFSLCFFYPVLAQSVDFKPDISRALFHQKVDESQAMLLNADGRRDDLLTPYADEELNLQITYHATIRIDQWQQALENHNSLSHQTKLGQLRGMSEMLKAFVVNIQHKGNTPGQLEWAHFPLMLDAFEAALELDKQDKSIFAAIEALPYTGAKIIANSFCFEKNPEVAQTKQFMLLKYLSENPDQILRQLEIAPNYTYPFVDSLVEVAARRNPEEFITHAQAKRSGLWPKINASPYNFVQLLNGLAQDNQGQMYLPFLHQIANNLLTKENIKEAVKDSAMYYALLVKTQIENAGLLQTGETVTSAQLASEVLKRKSLEVYVATINGLHDFGAPVRFKSIQGLNAEELYYLIVMNETEIYTSSFMYVYKRIFEVLPETTSDSLLHRVNFDRYKKFITMASNYNTLDDFLSRMDKNKAVALMIDFVKNLEKGSGENEIEDAVDVANAYATLTDPELRKLIRLEVDRNLEYAIANNNRKAITIYRLEKMIMASSDGDSTINLSDSLGILPIYSVKNDYLRDANGRIIMQMYFYGDAGGKGSFNTLVGLMGDRNQWKVNSTSEWVQFSSINAAVPFVLFANRALDEDQDLDEKAQWSLINWMESNGFSPSITVHRGHSYYLPYTIEKMRPSSKVVVLGSCGAYNNLADVLRISPEAYIIASKQVGYGVINIQLFMYLINELKRGKDVNWPGMMENVAKNVGQGRKSDFDDYIFPHRNLGAIFIKAYRIAMEQEI